MMSDVLLRLTDRCPLGLGAFVSLKLFKYEDEGVVDEDVRLRFQPFGLFLQPLVKGLLHNNVHEVGVSVDPYDQLLLRRFHQLDGFCTACKLSLFSNICWLLVLRGQVLHHPSVAHPGLLRYLLRYFPRFHAFAEVDLSQLRMWSSCPTLIEDDLNSRSFSSS